MLKLNTSRDGGTGRRSGLKIRRGNPSWGFDPPSRHHFGVIVHLGRAIEMALLIADSIRTPRRVNPNVETISEIISSSVRSLPSDETHFISSANSRMLYCAIEGLTGIWGRGCLCCAWASVRAG